MADIKHKAMILILLLAVTSSVVSGCGTVNVQASGGGASGFASLGVIILGTSALRHVRGTEQDPGHDADLAGQDDES